MTKEEYLLSPCRAASLPYWKAISITVPPSMRIVHEEDYDPAAYPGYTDEPYFRLYHDLTALSVPVLPEGFVFSCAAPEEFSAHIASCYEQLHISATDLRSSMQRPVYQADLWLVIRDKQGNIAASGIADLDKNAGEGILEWIQVSAAFRRRGLGRCMVMELLRRMAGRADFATVSGQCLNPTSPEQLYRACGFTGRDVWHILHKH